MATTTRTPPKNSKLTTFDYAVRDRTGKLVKTADGKGRVVACEVMVATPAIRNLIREGKTHQIYSALQAGAKHGMQTMDAHLAELVKRGKVTYDAALEKCHHVEDFNRLCGRG